MYAVPFLAACIETARGVQRLNRGCIHYSQLAPNSIKLKLSNFCILSTNFVYEDSKKFSFKNKYRVLCWVES